MQIDRATLCSPNVDVSTFAARRSVPAGSGAANLVSHAAPRGSNDFAEVMQRLVAAVIHETNQPLGVALAKTQTALQLLTAGQHSQLDGCLRLAKQYVRSASDRLRELETLLDDEASKSATAILRAVRTLAGPDARLAGCVLNCGTDDGPSPLVPQSGRAMLLLLRVVWDAIASGATEIDLVEHDRIITCQLYGVASPSSVLAEDSQLSQRFADVGGTVACAQVDEQVLLTLHLPAHRLVEAQR